MHSSIPRGAFQPHDEPRKSPTVCSTAALLDGHLYSLAMLNGTPAKLTTPALAVAEIGPE
jgi:hypothetical protein